jgi:hypothetical protein
MAHVRKPKQPHAFALISKRPFGMAGIWENRTSARQGARKKHPVRPSMTSRGPQTLTSKPTSANNEELSRIDRRLAELTAERREQGLAGAITMIAIGGTTLLFSVPLVMEVDYRTNDGNAAALIAYGAFAVVGGPLVIGGIIFLRSRIRCRHQMMPALRELKERRRVLQGLASGASIAVGDGRATASLAVRF